MRKIIFETLILIFISQFVNGQREFHFTERNIDLRLSIYHDKDSISLTGVLKNISGEVILVAIRSSVIHHKMTEMEYPDAAIIELGVMPASSRDLHSIINMVELGPNQTRDIYWNGIVSGKPTKYVVAFDYLKLKGNERFIKKSPYISKYPQTVYTMDNILYGKRCSWFIFEN